MLVKRIKSFGPNFAIYRVFTPVDCNVIGVFNHKLPGFSGSTIAAREITFCGNAKGKTGKHRLDADNTEVIEILGIRVFPDGKAEAVGWVLPDQDAIDTLYRQRVAFNI